MRKSFRIIVPVMLLACMGVLLLSLITFILSLTACVQKQDGTDKTVYREYDKDSDYIKSKGILTVGITDFEPMDFRNEGEWVGFDADMAKEFAEYLGVKAEFVEIEWDNKQNALDNGEIDCVWNGMTLNDKIQESMECTEPYLKNSQIIIVPKDNASLINGIEDCTHYLFAVESGSAGEQELQKLNYRYTAADTQYDAIRKTSENTADAAIVDSIMAEAIIGSNKEFTDLVSTISISDEEYGVGFRKGSDMAGILNDFFDKSYEDGGMVYIAEKYGVESSVIDRSSDDE